MAVEPDSGLWFSPKFDGHGFDLQRIDDRYVVVFYSYSENGEPVWYFSSATETDGVISGNFGLYQYMPDQTPPQQLLSEPGDFSIDFINTGSESVCEDQLPVVAGQQLAVFSWSIDEEEGQWCVTPLLEQGQVHHPDFTGLWWAGVEDEGWGLSLDFQGAAELRTEVAVVFYYDYDGFPRWAFGVSEEGGAVSEVPMQNFLGYCRTCPVLDLQATEAGSLRHEIRVESSEVTGVLDLELTYPYGPGGEWNRMLSPLLPLSDLQTPSVDLPEIIADGRTVAILDATLVPMTAGFPLIPGQSVLVENGMITVISPTADFVVPADTEVVNADGLYLAPGLTEMHFHISVGGESASEQAGLLMIANGVTSALNMGNSFSFDIPRLGRRFESGELVGPTLYAGQVAYGPDDGADASLTVPNSPAAKNYAEKLKTLDYDYIKTYWQLPLSAVQSFQRESLNLDLPLIGHIPLRQSMSESLSSGHRMAAHIQEPYVSFMNSLRNDSLFPEAAGIFLSYGAYLTPTLAVFESYVSISGGRQANFDDLIAREGQQYQPESIINAWHTYFNQRYIQNGNALDLDDLLAFYKRMTRFFFDAGVPLLTGTDGPGFPGVMSGFGVHEELRLLHEVGIPAPEVFAISTRNAGRFVDDTLQPEMSFGTIETGKRADLILTDRNPLESIENLKRPLAVMARGRFWSREYLQKELDKLKAQLKTQDLNDPRFKNTETLEFGPHH
jgi:hypothetical protein